MSTADHRADAEKLIGDVDDYLDDHRHETAEEVNVALATAMQANAVATLYLAEQQRIANLIAFLDAEGGPYKEINNIVGARESVIEQVREGLGLE